MAAVLGSRKPAVRNPEAATPEVGSSSRRAPALGDASGMAMAAAAAPPLAPLNRAHKAPSPASGCRCNPEAGVGVLAAFMDPAAAHLRVVEPIRAGARGILEVTFDPCGRRKPFRIAESMLACNLCYHRIGSGPLYMYKGATAFCKPECRYDYAMQELYEERQRQRQRQTITPAWKRVRRREAKGKAPEADGAGDGQGRMFFTCAEIP